MAVDGVKTHADNLDVFLTEIAHVVAQTARLLGTTAREVFGIEIQQNNLIANTGGEFPFRTSIIITDQQQCLVARFRHTSSCGHLHPNQKQDREDSGYAL